MHQSSLTLQCSTGPVQLRLLPGGLPGKVACEVCGACGPAAREIYRVPLSRHLVGTHCSWNVHILMYYIICLVIGSELHYTLLMVQDVLACTVLSTVVYSSLHAAHPTVLYYMFWEWLLIVGTVFSTIWKNCKI